MMIRNVIKFFKSQKNKGVFFSVALLCFFITNIFLPSYLNGFSYSSSINFYELIGSESFDMIFESRIEDPVFKKRILIYFIVKQVSYFLEIDFQLSYNLLFLTSLFFFFKYAFKVTKNFGIEDQNLVNSSIFLLSFPVFFLPTPLISGFEDMLQWALSMISFYFYINKKYILLYIFLLLSLLCRETSFVLILVFYLYRRFTIIEFVLFTFTISIFMFIFINLGEVKEASEFLKTKRFYAWKDNFNSIEKILNNLTLIFVSCFIPMILLWKENNLFLRKLFILTLVLIPFNAIVSLLNEVRISYYPLIFSFPFLYKYFELYSFNSFRDYFSDKTFIMLILMLFIFSFFIFYPLERKSVIFYQFYFFFYSIACLMIIRYKLRRHF